MNLNVGSNAYAGYYDIAQDPLNGAVGIVNLGVHIPKFSVNFPIALAIAIESITSAGGLATLSFGYKQTGVAIPIINSQAFIPTVPIAFFTLNDAKFANQLPTNFDFTSDLIMEIGVEPLLTGKLKIFLTMIQTEF